MTVQELIDKLQEIPDKNMPIALETPEEKWLYPEHLYDISGVRYEEHTMIGECYSIYYN